MEALIAREVKCPHQKVSQDTGEFRSAAGGVGALALPRGGNAAARNLRREDFTEAMPWSAYSLSSAKWRNCSSHTGQLGKCMEDEIQINWKHKRK